MGGKEFLSELDALEFAAHRAIRGAKMASRRSCSSCIAKKVHEEGFQGNEEV